MKKIMGHLTGKLSLSILTVIVLLVGVLAGMSGITSVKASGRSPAASAVQASSKGRRSPSKVSSERRSPSMRQPGGRVTTAAADTAVRGSGSGPYGRGRRGSADGEVVTKEAATHALTDCP